MSTDTSLSGPWTPFGPLLLAVVTLFALFGGAFLIALLAWPIGLIWSFVCLSKASVKSATALSILAILAYVVPAAWLWLASMYVPH